MFVDKPPVKYFSYHKSAVQKGYCFFASPPKYTTDIKQNHNKPNKGFKIQKEV